MTRKKYHITPESGRVCVSLGKKQLKSLKIIGVEFEIDQKDLLETAVNLLIHRYENLSHDEIEKKGKEVLFF